MLPARSRRLHGLWHCRQRGLQRPLGQFHLLGRWDAQLPRPWVQLALVVPILAMIVSLVDIIRRMELSLSPGHPTLLLRCSLFKEAASCSEAPAEAQAVASSDGLPGAGLLQG